MNCIEFLVNFFENLFGTFLGAMLAFLSSIAIYNMRSKKHYNENMKTLLLIIKENDTKIERIKIVIQSTADDLEKYEKIFGRYNFDICLHDVNGLLLKVQADLHTNYRDILDVSVSDGVYTSMYNVISNIVTLQSIIVQLQQNPEKEGADQNKINKLRYFDEFYNRYHDMYNKLINTDAGKKILHTYNIQA